MRAMTFGALLLSAFVLPASTSALPTDEGGRDMETPRRADTPSVPSVWDQPAPAAPIVVRAPALLSEEPTGACTTS